MSKKKQIDKLVNWIQKNCPEEIGNEGAGDVAVRLLEKYRKALINVSRTPFLGSVENDAANMINVCSNALVPNPVRE